MHMRKCVRPNKKGEMPVMGEIIAMIDDSKNTPTKRQTSVLPHIYGFNEIPN